MRPENVWPQNFPALLDDPSALARWIRTFEAPDANALADTLRLGGGADRAVHRDVELIGEGCVGERVGAGVGHGAGHVANGVVHNSVLHIHRVGVCCLMGRFDASALVNCDINNDSTWFH